MCGTCCETPTQILCNVRTNVQTVVTISLLAIQWALIVKWMNVKIVILLSWRDTLTLNLHNVSEIVIVMITLSLTAVIQRTLSLSSVSVIIMIDIDISIAIATDVIDNTVLVTAATETDFCHMNDVSSLNASDIAWSWKRYFSSILQTQRLTFSSDIIIKLSI